MKTVKEMIALLRDAYRVQDHNDQDTQTTCPRRECTSLEAGSIYERTEEGEREVIYECRSCGLRWEEVFQLLQDDATVSGGNSDGNIYMSSP